MRGEGKAVVARTGLNTRFNKAMHLVQESKRPLHMGRVVTQVVAVEMSVAAVMIVVGIIVIWVNPVTRANFADTLPALAAPVTLPPMITLTMALGSQQLVLRRVLTVRLDVIEDAARMSILCADKTGTLTINKLSVVNVVPYGEFSCQDVLLFALGAPSWKNMDAIDAAVFEAAKVRVLRDFVPFSAATRKTCAVITFPDGRSISVSKGAVKTISDDFNAGKLADAACKVALERGNRVLAVAYNRNLAGVLVFADPPRPDSASTIRKLHDLGVRLIMFTGDVLPVAAFVASQVGIGENIRIWRKNEPIPDDANSICGLAEIFFRR